MFVAVKFLQPVGFQVVMVIVFHVQSPLVFTDNTMLKPHRRLPGVEVHFTDG